jgi:hypothetical protein
MFLNPIQDVLLEQLATDPAQTKGRFFYSQALDCPVYSNGTTYLPMDARKATSIPLTALTVDPTARVNHTGTQLAATISDFNTAVRLNRLDQLTAPTASVAFGNQKLTAVANPTVATDGANKQWVEQASTTGNAGTATKLATARNISLSGVVTTSAIPFDGSVDIVVPTAIANDALTITMVNGLSTSLANKQPTLGYTPVNKAGDTLTGYLSAHAAPSTGMHLANKDYVDQAMQAAISNIAPVDPVVVVALATITLTGLQTIEGIALQEGQRVLTVAQGGDLTTPHINNDIWLASANAWTRSTGTWKTGTSTLSTDGTTTEGTQWYLDTIGTITRGTTALKWIKINQGAIYTNGNGLNLTANAFSVKPTTGIVVTGAGVGVDTGVVVRKFTAIIGDGATLSFNLTHNFGTKAITWALRNTVTDEFEFAKFKAESVNVTSVTFSPVAPLAGEYEVTIHG